LLSLAQCQCATLCKHIDVLGKNQRDELKDFDSLGAMWLQRILCSITGRRQLEHSSTCRGITTSHPPSSWVTFGSLQLCCFLFSFILS